MNASSIIVSAMCIGLIVLGIYILINNIRNQIKGKGCGSCKNCSGSCSGCSQNKKP